jgi:hypothetical protein
MEKLTVSSQSAMFLQAARLVAELHQRASFDTGALLHELIEGAAESVDGSVDLGLIFATHTALVWNTVQREQQFRTALVSRDNIGQAKGMLMERFDIEAAGAFELLKRVSQESNTPVAQIAQRVITGDCSLPVK